MTCRRSSRISIFSSTLVLAVVVASMVAAIAASTQGALVASPRLTITPRKAKPGGTLSVRGVRFAPNTDGTLILGSVGWASAGPALAEFQTDQSGTFRLKAVVPEVAAGSYVVTANVGATTASATVKVEAKAVQSPEPTEEPPAQTLDSVPADEPPTSTAITEPVSPTEQPTETDKPKATRLATEVSGTDPTHTPSVPDSSQDDPSQAMVAASAAEGLTFTPVADARVEERAPSQNFGTSTTLRVDGDAGARVTTFLRFEVTGLTSSAQRATLRLAVRSGTQDGPTTCSAANGWNEASINWANKPARTGGPTDDKSMIAAGSWVDYDVTSLVKGNGTYTLCLEATSSDGIDFYSRQYSNPAVRPQLVINQSGSAPPASATRPPTPTPTRAPGGPPGGDAALPLRAAFYYPWFPGAWDQKGITPYTNYAPSLGFYDGGDPAVLAHHVAAMQYGGIDAAIASWWGRGSREDRRLPALLAAAAGTGFRWSVYYEDEGFGDPAVEAIRADLQYLRDAYAADPGFLRLGGRFVVFVYGGAESCATATRWARANAAVGAYLVLKVFPGYRQCADQPDAWHQYAPAAAADAQAGHSYSISPGFWEKGAPVRLGRDLARWRQNVRDMVASGAPFQLVTTFNEWGEGTAVESAKEWASASGYGAYLDALHA
ncbi:MAG: hypothetical protein QOF33_4244, partial [Thermomicrobiales bacterium]|nr:hypothetical protein [Thermomicrobiales bacterium]